MSSNTEQKRGEAQCTSIMTETEVITTELQDIKKMKTSLVIQWPRIHLSMQGIWVPSLIWEKSTCSRAAKLVCHSSWGPCALEPVSHSYWAMPQLLKPVHLEPKVLDKDTNTVRSSRTTMKSNSCSSQLEKACKQHWRPCTAKNK